MSDIKTYQIHIKYSDDLFESTNKLTIRLEKFNPQFAGWGHIDRNTISFIIFCSQEDLVYLNLEMNIVSSNIINAY